MEKPANGSVSPPEFEQYKLEDGNDYMRRHYNFDFTDENIPDKNLRRRPVKASPDTQPAAIKYPSLSPRQPFTQSPRTSATRASNSSGSPRHPAYQHQNTGPAPETPKASSTPQPRSPSVPPTAVSVNTVQDTGEVKRADGTSGGHIKHLHTANEATRWWDRTWLKIVVILLLLVLFHGLMSSLVSSYQHTQTSAGDSSPVVSVSASGRDTCDKIPPEFSQGSFDPDAPEVAQRLDRVVDLLGNALDESYRRMVQQFQPIVGAVVEGERIERTVKLRLGRSVVCRLQFTLKNDRCEQYRDVLSELVLVQRDYNRTHSLAGETLATLKVHQKVFEKHHAVKRQELEMRMIQADEDVWKNMGSKQGKKNRAEYARLQSQYNFLGDVIPHITNATNSASRQLQRRTAVAQHLQQLLELVMLRNGTDVSKPQTHLSVDSGPPIMVRDLITAEVSRVFLRLGNETVADRVHEYLARGR